MLETIISVTILLNRNVLTLQKYLNQFAYGVANTNDLYSMLAEVSSGYIIIYICY